MVLLGRSRDPAKKIIERILEQRKVVETYLKEENDLVSRLSKSTSSAFEKQEALLVVQAKRRKLEDSISQSTHQLGVADAAELLQFTNNAFLHLCLNARSIKMRLRQRLRERKFELERLERCYRNALNGMHIICDCLNVLIYLQTEACHQT